MDVIPQGLEELNFDDLTPVEIRVSIFRKKYVLREIDEGDAVRWRNSQLRAARMSEGQVVSMGDLAESEPLLVSFCLYRANEDHKIILRNDGTPDKSTLTPLATIKSWPARIVKPLFERAKEISELEEKETKEVLEARIKDAQTKLQALEKGGDSAPKKEPSATTDTSS